MYCTVLSFIVTVNPFTALAFVLQSLLPLQELPEPDTTKEEVTEDEEEELVEEDEEEMLPEGEEEDEQ